MTARKYTILDHNVVGTWDGIGVKDAKDAWKKALSNDDEMLAMTLFSELIWSVVEGRLKTGAICLFLAASRAELGDECLEGFSDVLWGISTEIHYKEKGNEKGQSEAWRALAKFVRQLLAMKVFTEVELKRVLPDEMLVASELFESEVKLSKKIKFINTKVNYVQVKFNLMREETEGFSKVVALLNDDINSCNVDSVRSDLYELIGTFSLDPNRVLDLVLEVYETHLSNKAFPDLFQSFNMSNLPHIMGFKFQYYQRKETIDGNESTPKSLYRLAAMLIKKGLLQVDEILPHLSPNFSEIVENYEYYVKEKKAYNASYGKIHLNKKEGGDGEENEKEAPATMDCFLSHNQIYGLIEGLFDIGCFDKGVFLVQKLHEYGVNPMDNLDLATSVSNYIYYCIKDIYEPLSQSKLGLCNPESVTRRVAPSYFECQFKVQNADDLIENVFPMLQLISLQLHHDSLTLVMICRLLVHYYPEHWSSSDNMNAAMFEDVLVECILPSLSMTPCNPGTTNEIWNILKPMEFQRRYRIYQRWHLQYEGNYHLELFKAKLIDTRKNLRKLNSSNTRAVSRQLIKVAHSNPLIIFSSIITLIQSYDNMAGCIVDAFKYMSTFPLDVLSYCLVSSLSSDRDRVKEDGTSTAQWITFLAKFTGLLYRKHPNVELVGVLQFIIAKLKARESADLIVLCDLLSSMGLCVNHTDISDAEVERRAGGPSISYEGGSDPKKRSASKLRDALTKSKLLYPLLILIGQQRNHIVYHTNVPQMKRTGHLYDECQGVLNQMVVFMNQSISPSLLIEGIPTLSTWCNHYHVPFDVAMTVCRPVIRAADKLLRGSSKVENSNWAPLCPDFLKDIKSIFSAEIFQNLSVDCFAIFWSMSLYDFFVPHSHYEKEQSRLRKEFLSLSQQPSGTMSSSEAKRKEKKLSQAIDKVTNDQTDQVAHRKKVFQFLEGIKDVLVHTDVPEGGENTFVEKLLEKCIVPRALFTPEDALFCAKFVEHLHSINTKGFSSLNYYYRVNVAIPPLVLCITEREASNLAVFLKETFGLLHRWYQNPKDYKKEALTNRIGYSIDLNDPSNLLQHSQYTSMYSKWQKSLESTFLKALKSSDFMANRNALIVLIKLIDVFPLNEKTLESMIPIVEVMSKDERMDLSAKAKGYLGMLKLKASKLKRSDDSSGERKRSSSNARVAESTRGSSRETRGRDDRTSSSRDKSRSSRSGADPALSDTRSSRESRSSKSAARDNTSEPVISAREVAARAAKASARSSRSSKKEESRSGGREENRRKRSAPESSDGGGSSSRSRKRERTEEPVSESNKESSTIEQPSADKSNSAKQSTERTKEIKLKDSSSGDKANNNDDSEKPKVSDDKGSKQPATTRKELSLEKSSGWADDDDKKNDDSVPEKPSSTRSTASSKSRVVSLTGRNRDKTTPRSFDDANKVAQNEKRVAEDKRKRQEERNSSRNNQPTAREQAAAAARSNNDNSNTSRNNRRGNNNNSQQERSNRRSDNNESNSNQRSRNSRNRNYNSRNVRRDK